VLLEGFVMKLGLGRLVGGAAALLLTMAGTASATSITVTAVYDSSTESATPPTGFGFTLLPLGTSGVANQNMFQTTSLSPIDGISFTFSGGTPTLSGEYAGNVTNSASPFGTTNSQSDYFSAGGTGGEVTLTYPTPQTELDLLWGTVDTASGRNVLVAGSTLSGADIENAVNLAGFTFNEGIDDVYLEITGLPSFTQATFSDGNSPAFEFVPGVPGSVITVVPEPATLLLMGSGLIALGRKLRRKR
jgi:hypothetical protein